MADPIIDKEAFLRRIRKLYSFWKVNAVDWFGLFMHRDTYVVVLGGTTVLPWNLGLPTV